MGYENLDSQEIEMMEMQELGEIGFPVDRRKEFLKYQIQKIEELCGKIYDNSSNAFLSKFNANRIRIEISELKKEFKI